MKQNDMTQGAIFPVLARFTLPLLLGDLFQQLYNIVDTVIVGRTLGAGALAAVGATGTIMFLIVGGTIALNAGLGIVTAQRFGAGDSEGVRKSFANGLYLSVAFAACLSMICLLLCRTILTVMRTPEDILADSAAYINVIFGGLILTSLYNFFAANLRATGNSRIPLYFLLFSSCLNVVLDLLFIVGFGWGVAGASGATVLAQGISALLCGIYIRKKESVLWPCGREWKLQGRLMGQQLAVAIPMMIQSMITASGTMVMQAATNVFGSTAVAAVTASTKCRTMFTIVLMSTGNGIATFVGQNYGAGNMQRVKEGVRTAVRFVILYAIAAGIIAYALLPWELKLFITDAKTLAALYDWARTAMFLSVIFFIPLGFIFVFRAALQTCGHSVFAMSAGIVELMSRLVFAYCAIRFHIFACACLCDSAAWFMAGVFTCVSFWVLVRRS